MVYTGKPSRGCDVCRKSRVKCDETVPSCSNCIRKRISCLGYKSQFDVAWRSQNVVAEKSVLRRQKLTEKSTPSFQVQRINKSAVITTIVPAVLHVQLLSQDFEAYALNFFFSSYLFLPKDIETDRGMLECLTPIWPQTSPDSPLRPAVVAVASLMLEAWSQVRPDQPHSLSRSHYTQGIAALSTSLHDKNRIGDDVLMAALMLDMYESVRSFCLGQSNNSPHAAGTAALIKQRKQLPISGSLSQRILLGARHQVLGRAIRNLEPLPSDVFVPQKTAQDDFTKSVAHRLDDIALDLVNSLKIALQLEFNGTVDKLVVAGILKKVIELDDRLLNWRFTVPSNWAPTRVSGPKCIPQQVRDAGSYQHYCDVYSSIFIADTINSYCCLRIRNQLIMQACCDRLGGKELLQLSTTTLETIQDLADTICASVPYHLGDRTTIARIDDRTVQYPHIAGLPTPTEHMTAAAGYAGVFLSPQLAELMSPKVSLRFGQRQWIGSQLMRARNIYMVPPT